MPRFLLLPHSIDDIRVDDASPGLRDYEVCLLRLLESVSNGSVVEINETGTRLRYTPGVLAGGAGLEHDCGTARALGYFMEPLVCLAIFAKKARGRRGTRSRRGALIVACVLSLTVSACVFSVRSR